MADEQNGATGAAADEQPLPAELPELEGLVPRRLTTLDVLQATGLAALREQASRTAQAAHNAQSVLTEALDELGVGGRKWAIAERAVYVYDPTKPNRAARRRTAAQTKAAKAAKAAVK